MTVAAAMAYRQMLCSRAFCQYTQHFFVNGDFQNQKKLFIFLYQVVPRFVSVFDQCAGQMLTVRDILGIREEKAWKLYENVIPTQDLAYLFCQDMLAVSSIVAEDLNLCGKCGKKTAGHPPETCSFVTKELNEFFSSKRAEFKKAFKKHEPAFNNSPVEMGSSLKKKF